MTAEIGVLNRHAVALAADSAVSIGKEADKIYTSADKLFQLSRNQPIGIMIYGNADFATLPWEVVIKSYRSASSNKTFKTLQEQCDDFLQFLNKSKLIFTPERQLASTRDSVVGFMFFIAEKLEIAFSEYIKLNKAITKRTIPSIVSNVIESTHKSILKNPKLKHFRISAATLANKHKTILDECRLFVFEKLPMSRSIIQNLYLTTCEMLLRKSFGPHRTGIVIAGYGENDYTPQLMSYEFDGMLNGVPRYHLDKKQTINHEILACIAPFAQKEMVDSFMRGIHSHLFDYMAKSSGDLVNGLFKHIIDLSKKHAPKLGRVLEGQKNLPEKLLRKLFDDWLDQTKEFSDPVMQIASTLPKDELAAMAESLVNLTKFRHRVTNVRETVGGPIDVAVISKGDGFVWIKRKHYFSANLNPRIMNKYQKETFS
ncbi:MAG: hypothetical protein QM811_11575 [Pirellulales bacterium]